jgi:hypothetical protein
MPASRIGKKIPAEAAQTAFFKRLLFEKFLKLRIDAPKLQFLVVLQNGLV